MISGHLVKPSALQQALPMINAAIGGFTSNNLDTDQQKIAQRLRLAKTAAEEKISNLAFGTPDTTTELAGPYTGKVPMPLAVKEGTKPDLVAALRQINDPYSYGAGADLKPLLYKQMMPEATPEEKRFKAAVADGSWNVQKMGGLNSFLNQMSDKDKAQVRMENLKYNLDKQKFDADYAPFNPATFGQTSPQAVQQNMPSSAPMNVGSPVVKPVGLAPVAPAYAQGAMNFQTNQTPQLSQQANPQQTLPAPPAWVRTQKDYRDFLKSESEPLTEFQGKAVLYGSSMLQANNVINSLATEGTTKGAVVPNFLSGIAALAPLGVGDAAVNAIQATFRADPTGLVGPDKNQQKLAQAQLGFAIPYLRQTSGANFGAKEVADTIAEFFPLRGESDDVAKQKEASRNRVIQGMKSVSGRGARQIDELGAISASSSGWGKAQVINK
jgi:hypothetical protein